MSPLPQAGPENLGEDSFISLAEVTEVVKKHPGGKAPGVDKIRPECHRSADGKGPRSDTAIGCNN